MYLLPHTQNPQKEPKFNPEPIPKGFVPTLPNTLGPPTFHYPSTGGTRAH